MSCLKIFWDVFRPLFWIIPFLSYNLGIAYSGQDVSISSFLPAIISLLLITASVFPLNSVIDAKDTDEECDFLLEYRNPCIYWGISSKKLIYISALFALLGIIVSFLTYSLGFIVIAVLGVVLSVFYSAYPRLKGKAPFDIICNVLGFFLLPFLGGWMMKSQSLNHVPIEFLMGTALLIGSMYILTTMIDFNSDKKAGLNTFTVKFGKLLSLRLSLFLYICGVSLLYLASSFIAYIILVFACFPYIAAVVKNITSPFFLNAFCLTLYLVVILFLVLNLMAGYLSIRFIS